ncbi:MAG TPA: DegT/DnrJ/EryC1/StrS family aminotransferase [Tepidisphaeraceae bacterium]|nr:DegT/DnrJ/EryC1/StrS family aminotransferase [Tepidisphaeraceae bacterium]
MDVKLLDLQAQYLPMRNEIRRAIDAVCDEQALILGPHVERFEKSLAEYCGTKHAIGVSSGTDALLCTLMAMGIKPGDEVICPAFTFFATAGSIARLGAVPVFCDIDPGTFNLDVTDAARRITPKTRAIMPVHLFGQCADMEAVNALAAAHRDVKVIEDAAQAIGAQRNGGPACSLAGRSAEGAGGAGCLSFYPTKNLGAFGDAGAICTDDDALATRCRKLRVHGSGHTYHHEMIGGMFRLAALQAAVLSVKLKYLNEWHAARRRNAALYDKLLAGAEGKIIPPKIAAGNFSIYNQYVVRILPPASRDAVKQTLAERGISTAVYYPIPLHLQECFAYLGHKEGDLPQSERACREVLALPVHPELATEQVKHVAAALLAAVG